MLLNIVREHGEDIADMILVIRTKDDKALKFASTSEAGFLSVAAFIVQRLAIKSIEGELHED